MSDEDASRRLRLVAGIVVLGATGAALLVIGVLLGLLVVGRHGGGPIQGWDNQVQAWDILHRAGLVGASKVVAVVGDAPLLGILVVVATAVALLVTRSVRSLILLVAYVGGELLVFLVREVVHRPRPRTADFPAPHAVPGVHETSWSFPSGHSVAVTAVLFALLGTLALARHWWWPWVAALVGSLFVADTRLVLGVHWFSDVVFGLIVGAAWGTTVALAFENLAWEELRVGRDGDRPAPS